MASVSLFYLAMPYIGIAQRATDSMRTIADWMSLSDMLRFNIVRTKLRLAGKPTMNLNKGQPLHDVLQQGFLRAYEH